jgi:hypothetical protein
MANVALTRGASDEGQSAPNAFKSLKGAVLYLLPKKQAFRCKPRHATVCGAFQRVIHKVIHKKQG